MNPGRINKVLEEGKEAGEKQKRKKMPNTGEMSNNNPINNNKKN